MTVIDGKALAQKARAETKAEVAAFTAATGVTPKLCVLRVGNDAGSEVYVRNKAKSCVEVGMLSEVVHRPECTQREAESIVERWNADPAVSAILVQLPLLPGMEERAILERIDPKKDVDAFHPLHVGRLVQGRAELVPCTPRGVMRLIEEASPAATAKGLLSGKHAVVVGRSQIVGKPVAQLLLAANATVTICHSHTRDLGEVVRQGDVVVAAIGRPEMIRGAWIKPGAIVIDVGINRGADGRLLGDVEFAAAATVAAAITPVPGGVGPMTIAMLLENALICAKLQARATPSA